MEQAISLGPREDMDDIYRVVENIHDERANLAEARWFARRRQEEHNHERPHSSLDYQTPAQFAAACAASAAPALQQHTRHEEEDKEIPLPVPQPILSELLVQKSGAFHDHPASTRRTSACRYDTITPNLSGVV